MALAHVLTVCSCDPSNLMKPAPAPEWYYLRLIERVRPPLSMALAHVLTVCSCDPSNLIKPAPAQNGTTFTLLSE